MVDVEQRPARLEHPCGMLAQVMQDAGARLHRSTYSENQRLVQGCGNPSVDLVVWSARSCEPSNRASRQFVGNAGGDAEPRRATFFVGGRSAPGGADRDCRRNSRAPDKGDVVRHDQWRRRAALQPRADFHAVWLQARRCPSQRPRMQATPWPIRHVRHQQDAGGIRCRPFLAAIPAYGRNCGRPGKHHRADVLVSRSTICPSFIAPCAPSRE